MGFLDVSGALLSFYSWSVECGSDLRDEAVIEYHSPGKGNLSKLALVIGELSPFTHLQEERTATWILMQPLLNLV